MKEMNYILLLFLSLSLSVCGVNQHSSQTIPEHAYKAVDNDFNLILLVNNQAGDVQDDDSNQTLPEKSHSNHTQIQSLESKGSLRILRKKIINHSYASETCEYLTLDLPPPMLG